MRSVQPATIVIACPHCGTRYQVPPETIGNKGRKVACAHCGESWQAEMPPPPPPVEDDRLFAPEEEDKLDRELDAEAKKALANIPAGLRAVMPEGKVPPPEVVRSIAEIKKALLPKPKPKVKAAKDAANAVKENKNLKTSKSRIDRRQIEVARDLPIARLRRVARIVALSTLALVVGSGFLFRTDIVRAVPAMAGVYSVFGIGVNVIGLDFSDVTTVKSHKDGADLITVTARIYGVETRHLTVPPVIVTLLDEHGKPLYQWSVSPKVRDIEPGEIIDFSAELASPPPLATRVKLSFAGGVSRPESAISPPAEGMADGTSSAPADGAHGEGPDATATEAPTDTHSSPEAAAHHG
jgi:predicted Zn finger-like uncharacterized protein